MATVRTILDRKGTTVVSVGAEQMVVDAAQLMNDRSIGGVVVTKDGKMVGIFTERDILRRVVAEGRSPAETAVEEVMTAPVVTCRSDASVDECAGLVTEKRIRHLPVVDDDQPCGLITSGDLLALQVREQQETINYLHNYVSDTRS